MIDYRFIIYLFKVFIYPLHQFFLGLNTNAFQELTGKLTEKSFYKVQPGTMLRSEYKLKPSGNFCKVLTCLLGCVYFEIIQCGPSTG